VLVEGECAKHGAGPHYVFASSATPTRRRCKRCVVESVSRRRRLVLSTLIEERGGRCQVCGYSRCSQALEWHHLDPASKDLELSGGTLAIATLRAEAQKCLLVCANCHREIHYGLVDVTPFL
jgi:hypothetical protein